MKAPVQLALNAASRKGVDHAPFWRSQERNRAGLPMVFGLGRESLLPSPGSGHIGQPFMGHIIQGAQDPQTERMTQLFLYKGVIFLFVQFFFQHCFICHHSDSTVSEDAGNLGSNQGQLRLRNWLSDTLMTRLDLRG